MARLSRSVPRSNARDLAVRALLGLAGGVAVWAVIRWTPSAEPMKALRVILALAALTLPVVLLGAYGALRTRTLALWTLAAAGVSVLGGLGRTGVPITDGHLPIPEGGILFLTCLALAIGHVLVRARDGGGKVGPSWSRHFSIAWSDGLRALLSAVLVGVLLGLFGLAAGLFKVIGLEQVDAFLFRPGVLWPVSGLVFGLGVHFTAGRESLAEGVRVFGLGLLAWFSPLLTLLVAAFLASLPFTGLEPLWKTGSAAALLVGACVGLIVLVTAAIQEETNPAKIPRLLRYAVRLGGLLMAPLVAIAAVGVFLRIGQYGLSPDRVRALACLLVLAVFAGGHALAALSRRGWLDAFGKANLAGVVAALAATLFTLSLPGDPYRLTVLDQTRRLISGQVAPDRFDFDVLRFDTGEPGRSALRRLAARQGATPRDAEIRQLAAAALARTWRERVRLGAPVVTIVGSSPLPAGFQESDATRPCDAESPCSATSLDISGDGRPEVLLQRRVQLEVWALEGEGWRRLGEMDSGCSSDLEAFQAGDIRIITPEIVVRDVQVGTVRYQLIPDRFQCPPQG